MPATAVQQTPEGKAYVWKVDPKTMTVDKAFVELTEGMAEDRVRLKEGVAAGDQIAISGVMQLAEGTQVREFKTAGN